MPTKAEIAVLRQKERDRLASQTPVKYLLQIAENGNLVTLIVSFIIAFTLISTGLYLYEALLLLYTFISSSNHGGLYNFATTSIIFITTFCAIKYQGIDRYIQGQILGTLFVLRSDAIQRNEIDEPDTLLDNHSIIVFEHLLQNIEVFVTGEDTLKKSSGPPEDVDEAFDEEPTSLPLPKSEPVERANYRQYKGFWNRDRPCILYQFNIDDYEMESVFSKLKNLEKFCPPTKLWAENAAYEEASDNLSGSRKVQFKKTEKVYIYFMLLKTTPLSELPEAQDKKFNISKQNLSYMKLFAENIAKLHEEGLFGKLSLSTAYYVEQGGFDTINRVASFSPDWIEDKQLTESEKVSLKLQEVAQFGAILVEFFGFVDSSKLAELREHLTRNEKYIATELIQKELQAIPIHEPGNERLKLLIERIFAYPDNRPNMAEVAAELAKCYEERDEPRKMLTKKYIK